MELNLIRSILKKGGMPIAMKNGFWHTPFVLMNSNEDKKISFT
jgi:hypothetical protein